MNNKFYIHKINSILRDNIAHRKQKGTLSGDICHKNLYKIKTSPRVFEKKGIISKKKYNIALVMDVSGSLANKGLINIAADACCNFIKDFQELSNLMVCSFNTKFTIEKSLKNKNLDKNSIENMRNNIIDKIKGSYAFGNHDGYALIKTYEEIKKKDGDNIIIMTTDGCPNCDFSICKNPGCFHREEMEQDLKEKIHFVESKNIPVIGIGLGSGANVKDFYKRNVPVSNPNEYYENLCITLKKAIRRKAYA